MTFGQAASCAPYKSTRAGGGASCWEIYEPECMNHPPSTTHQCPFQSRIFHDALACFNWWHKRAELAHPQLLPQLPLPGMVLQSEVSKPSVR